jgi:hypothetical protein
MREGERDDAENLPELSTVDKSWRSPKLKSFNHMENIIQTPEQPEREEHERLLEDVKASEGKIATLLEEMESAISTNPDRAKGEEEASREFGPRIDAAYRESRKALDNWLASVKSL